MKLFFVLKCREWEKGERKRKRINDFFELENKVAAKNVFNSIIMSKGSKKDPLKARSDRSKNYWFVSFLNIPCGGLRNVNL